MGGHDAGPGAPQRGRFRVRSGPGKSPTPSLRTRWATSTSEPTWDCWWRRRAARTANANFACTPSPGGRNTQQPVYGIGVESPRRVWYGCGLGLCLLEGGRVRPVAGSDVPRESWRGFLIDRQGTLWVRSYSGLIALTKGAAKFVRRDDGLPASGRNPAVLTDRDGELYVPTAQGLARRTATGWTLLRKANGLPTSAVDFFLQDREGSAWIALDGGGLVRWLGYKTAETWTETEGLSHDVVWSLWRDERSSLWAATAGRREPLSSGTRPLAAVAASPVGRRRDAGGGQRARRDVVDRKSPGRSLPPRPAYRKRSSCTAPRPGWPTNGCIPWPPMRGTALGRHGLGPLPGNPQRRHLALRARPASRRKLQDGSGHPGGQPRNGVDRAIRPV